MASVKYLEIEAIETVLNEWWTVHGLPIALQKAVLNVKKALAENKAQRDELRRKIVDEYCERDESGTPIVIDEPVMRNGEPATDENGSPIIMRFTKFTDPDTANAKWHELSAMPFDCPAIAEKLIEPYAEKLNITLEKLEVIEPIIATE